MVVSHYLASMIMRSVHEGASKGHDGRGDISYDIVEIVHEIASKWSFFGAKSTLKVCVSLPNIF